MTPSLFDLPLRLSDAASLAPLLFEQLGSRPVPVTSEQRLRVAARAGGLRFSALQPCYGSLERDPVHPSACYLCVDAIDGQPLLLRVAPASTPSSGLFPRSILIGRTFVGREETVFNVVPFGPGDRDNIQTFAAQLNPAFQPKSLGAKAVVRYTAAAPAISFPLALQAFHRRENSRSQEEPVFVLGAGQDAAAFYNETRWAAIRAGWREGYGIQINHTFAGVAGFTRFGIESAADLPSLRRPCDIELITTLQHLEPRLRALKVTGCTVQSVALRDTEPPPEGTDALVREYRAVLNLRTVHLPEPAGEILP